MPELKQHSENNQMMNSKVIKTSARKLPPLLSTSNKSNFQEFNLKEDYLRVPSSSPSPRSSPSPVRSANRSKYHINCFSPSNDALNGSEPYFTTKILFSARTMKPNIQHTFSNNKMESKKLAKNKNYSTHKSWFTRRSCSQEFLAKQSLNRRTVTEFLEDNFDFLENYVMNNIEVETLERWMIRKMRVQKRSQTAGQTSRKTSLSRWKFCVHADKRKMLQDLTNSLYMRPNKVHILTELCATIASAVNADNWSLYLYDSNTKDISLLGHRYNFEDNFLQSTWNEIKNTVFCDIEASNMTVTSFVAHSKESARFAVGDYDERFPKGIKLYPKNTCFILSYPVLQADGTLIGVLELYRSEGATKFNEEDEEIINSYLVWGGIALHYAELYANMARQRKLNNFLLTVVKSIFQDMVSMDAVIVKIMAFAQRLVDADRASLFLVDGETKELYARIFDVSGGDAECNQSKSDLEIRREIRFPIGTGIAGYVAATGEALNIPNAYDDQRFNRHIDQQTGYTTKNLLCMPIFIKGCVIGVVQMVNKNNGTFNKGDEESFATFAVYCGLALHHARLYDKIRISEQKYKVALEILSYHNTCNDEELQAMKEITIEEMPNLSDISPYSLTHEMKLFATIKMFHELFGVTRFESDDLYRFCLTVRKNYRRVPYHNWTHGFSVANSMFVILKNCSQTFKPLEEFSLFVSCLCHDLDHRGKTNQFLVNSASPLAAIYTTSTLEHHHFNQTVSILQQEGHNILKSFNSEEYKEILRNIKHCILATDLAQFFPNRAKLEKLINENIFDLENTEHRFLLEAITMTACDLCASTKPWDQQKETVKIIFEEFYAQGDEERRQGRNPIPMMDRTKIKEQPASQVGFLKEICIPCYQLLAQVIPSSKPMLEGCLKNLKYWEEEMKSQFIQEHVKEDSL